MTSRYLTAPLQEHLAKLRQMVFLVGPRQVGKTTLAKSLVPEIKNEINYLNWDLLNHRKILSTQIFPDKNNLSTPDRKIMIFDEIHKYPRWKNALKGLFDHYEPNTHWIITGSASLNVYRKGQDSLVGRSFTYHLCPFSVAELENKKTPFSKIVECSFPYPEKSLQKTFLALLKFGGFPEPYTKGTETFLSRWRQSRLDRLINQDLAAIENLKLISLVENLVFLLPERVGQPLSLNSLRETLEVHFATVKHWIELLERIFYGISIRPFSEKLSRGLTKEKKWYLWDWSEVPEEGSRFENMTAIHLLKYVKFNNDLGLDELSLHYVRDKEKREVDFLICQKKKPFLLIECKLKTKEPTSSLRYFSNKLNVKRAIQITAEAVEPKTHYHNKIPIDVVSAASFFQYLV